MNNQLTRRHFIQTAAAGSAALTWLGGHSGSNVFAADAAKPAVLGGKPAHTGGWPKWPEWHQEWEAQVLDVLRSGKWCRAGGGGQVPEFEAAWAKLLGVKRALATSSGTTALLTSLYVVGVDAGDEVIVSPFTFNAAYNVILTQKALPVFADTDPETLTMCPKSIESRITERTKAILPVHIYGMPCDMDPINAIAKKHKLAVVEDACQANMAEYKGRKCGTLGDLGCFSFQNSKHMPAGEGGAVTGMSDELLDRCHSFHNCGRSVGSFKGHGCFARGTNYRMQHFQAAMLLQRFDYLQKETQIRHANSSYLNANLGKIPGIAPARLPENSWGTYYLFPFLYDAQQFNGLPRAKFIRALGAEGIPCGAGYGEQYNDGIIDEAINSTGYKRLWSADRLKAYRESFNELKGTKKACETVVCFSHSLLMADRSAMDHILDAIRKIQAHSAELVKKA
ncbi:MAG: DegT/DnrJ/EryC1/StrS family aminotransferase [Verrucomicrobia bacterium]|nr:DegT/DnrJ/EryC1/StrS family aminotransferase [Verrucomicrobiota bacterium]